MTEATVKKSTSRAAVDIQRTWRGHHDRNAVQEKLKAREQKRHEYLERANMLEAVLLLQTRARIIIAKARRTLLLNEKRAEDAKVVVTPSLAERRVAAEAAASDIQRIWRGHEARKIASENSQQRKRKREEYLERANLLEAVLLIQTRIRILLAKSRYRVRARALKATKLSSSEVSKVDGSVETLQRVWRGHEGRKRAGALKAERDRKRQEHLEKANMLESVLLIQTRARIFIARARRHLQAAVLDSVSPSHSRQFYEIDQAATNIQRVWRGHHDRTATKVKADRRRKAKQEYFDRANLLESVLMIQTRIRMFRARIHLNKLKKERLIASGNRLASDVVASPASKQHTEPKPPAAARPIDAASSSTSSSYRRPLPHNNNNNNNNHNASSNPSSPTNGAEVVSGVHQRTNVYSLFPARGSPINYAKSANPSPKVGSNENNNNNNNNSAGIHSARLSGGHQLQMYKVPSVSKSGFYVRSYEENVGPNIYQNFLMSSSSGPANSGSNNNTNQQLQQQHQSQTSRGIQNNNHNNDNKKQRVAVVDKPKYSDVLDSAHGVRNYVERVFSSSGGEVVVGKQQALHAFFDCCGSDKLPVIVEVWEAVTPFGSSENLSKDQFFLILEQLRAIKVVSETKKSLEKAEM